MNSLYNKTGVVLFLFVTQLLIAQTGSVKGKVISEGKPVEFASIYLRGTELGALSDTLGLFKVEKIPVGTYKIAVSCLGFKSSEKNITIKDNEVVTANFDILFSENSLNEVVISGTMKEVSKLESAVPVEVFTAKFFKSNPTPSVFESLQNVNGVRPQLNCNVCNTGDIHINGLEGPYTMILIDGMPIVSGLSTVYGLTGIPQSLIERVEIVKGPASTLYGSEAVGGLINIITKKPSNAPLFSADTFSSDWGDVNTDLGMKFNAGKKAESILGINYFNYQNIKDNNNDGFTDITLQDRISLFNKWTLRRNENRLFSIAGRYVYEDRWGGETRWNKSYRGGNEVYGESIYTSRWETFGTYELPVKEKILFQFSANGHSQNSVYGETIYNAQQTIGFGQLTWFKTIQKHDVLVGAAYRYTFYDDDTPVTLQSNGIENKPSIIKLPGIFVQDEINFNAQHKLLLGVRYDYNSIHGSVFSPRANYKISSKNKKNILRFSTGNGYRVANVFTEDHAALTGARTVVFKSNLKPETSWNGNINFVKKMYAKNGTFIGLDATAFYTYFNNRIIPDYLTNSNEIIYDNLDGFAVSQGISLNLDIQLPNGFSAIIGSTLMDVNFTDQGIKQRQILTERFSGVWSIGYAFKKIGVSIDYTGNIYGAMNLPTLGDLDNRPSESPVWSIQNIQFTKKFKKGFEIYGGVKNLLNYTPPANSIARSFDPFDKGVTFSDGTNVGLNGQVVPQGQVVATSNNPNALTFDPTYVFAPNQGIRSFAGVRYTFF